MGRIDEIKRKIEWSSYHGDIGANEVEEDIEFLLSRLEIAEKALDNAKMYADMYHQRDMARNLKEAIRQLRE